MASPTAAETLTVQRTITDLATFAEVTVRKESTFVPADSVQSALARLGNDNAKLMKAINEGLKAEERRQLGDTPGDWLVVDEDGKTTDQPFQGIQADNVKVNLFVLQMAKTVYSYNKDMTAEQKTAAKAAAIEMIKSTPVIFEGMKKNCAVTE